MNKLEVVIVLLIVMILLLVEPQEKRQAKLSGFILLGACCAGIYYLGPFVLGPVMAIKEAHGWVGIATLASVLVMIAYIILAVFGIRSDLRKNRAIEAGSQVAFDSRVDELVAMGYSREKAIAAVTRLRDEEQDTERHGARWFLKLLHTAYLWAFHKETLDRVIGDKNNVSTK